MPGFVQIMEFTTSRIEEVDALAEQMRAERGPALLATRAVLGTDRDHAGHYLTIVEFTSYDEAMRNSTDPVTSDFAARMAKLLDGPPTFSNLDVRTVLEPHR